MGLSRERTPEVELAAHNIGTATAGLIRSRT